MKLNIALWTLILCSVSNSILAVKVDTAWVRRYNGPGNFFDCAYNIVVDKQYNVYVTGISVGAGTGNDYFTIKYNSQGDTVWTRRYDESYWNGVNDAFAMALDSSGNIIVTGMSAGPDSSYDYLTIKYDSDGNLLWAQRYNGPIGGWDEARAITVDSGGNVYVTGLSAETDSTYDPQDWVTIKYNSSGDTLWVRRHGVPGYMDKARAIAVDNLGNVYVTGYTKYLTAGPCDFTTVKYDSLGNVVWIRDYNYSSSNTGNEGKDIAIDSDGNIYVTGGSLTENSFDYTTIKYSSSGDSLWVRMYNGPKNGYDYPSGGIAIDNNGNVSVTGRSTDTAKVVYATIKYNSLGDSLWLRKCGVGTTVQDPSGIAVDEMGNVYVTGESGEPGSTRYLTVAYNSIGDELWIQTYELISNSYNCPLAITVDDSGNVYVTGTSEGSGTHYDYATIKYIQTSGVEETNKKGCETLSLHSNPIKKEIELRFLSSANEDIKISLYDISGRLVRTLFTGKLNTRVHTRLRFSVEDLSSGIYFLLIQINEVREVKKVVKIK